MTRHRLTVLLIALAAAVPYLPTIDDYFVQDDFGVVALLSSKSAGYFPRWFVIPWMENIWGEPPDEIRPFTAVTYQLAALGGAASPVANHLINIAFHAVNALLVFRVGEAAAGLSPIAAAVGALMFAILPMQTESVAWITGRVDSMPACFYLASFLLYVRWRATPRVSLYVWSVLAYFVALFTKQNTVTLPIALVLYDLFVARRPIRVSWRALRPYLPFVVLTAGYLALRYVLFGEVAREGRLSAPYIDIFLQDLSVHLRRMVFGEPGLRLSGLGALVRVAAGVAIVAIVAGFSRERNRAAIVRTALYFLVVWVALGLAPTIVAGYGSPRHVYLASVGWTVSLGLAFDVLWHARPRLVMRGIGVALAGALVAAYAVLLRDEVRVWGIRAEVSRRVVVDIERETASSPPGTLVLVDAPPRSWNFALPHALRPPFTSEDLPERVSFISHSSIHCCPAYLWEEYTRRAMRAWAANAARPPVIALRWEEDTGELFRLRDSDNPFVRSAVDALLETSDVASLDRLFLHVSRGMVVTEAGRR
jgi:hypothetical protein